jgi:hypothetical protein
LPVFQYLSEGHYSKAFIKAMLEGVAAAYAAAGGADESNDNAFDIFYLMFRVVESAKRQEYWRVEVLDDLLEWTEVLRGIPGKDEAELAETRRIGTD